MKFEFEVKGTPNSSFDAFAECYTHLPNCVGADLKYILTQGDEESRLHDLPGVAGILINYSPADAPYRNCADGRLSVELLGYEPGRDPRLEELIARTSNRWADVVTKRTVIRERFGKPIPLEDAYPALFAPAQDIRP
jgi:hypothetical protein